MWKIKKDEMLRLHTNKGEESLTKSKKVHKKVTLSILLAHKGLSLEANGSRLGDINCESLLTHCVINHFF